jgi:uncharacterized protein YbjT (DUF2867 family)
MIMSTADIAVIGAAGPTGRTLMRSLARHGAAARALVRSEEGASRLPAGSDVRVAELADKESLVSALDGVRVVHYIPPTYEPREEAFGSNVVEAASRAGVERLVYHSVLHAPTPAMRHHWRKAQVELLIRESALAWTIVQPGMYMQTAFAFLSADRTKFTPGFDVTRPFNPVDVEDLADAVATVLTEEGHAFATYELAGSETLDFASMAAQFGDVLHTTTTAEALDPSLVLATARERGFSEASLEELRLMMEHYDAHGLMGNPNVLRMLLGREPARFSDVVRRTYVA